MLSNGYVALCGLALSAAACAAQPVIVNTQGLADGISVSGTGEVRAAPDIARMNVGVEVRTPDAQQASQLGAERMKAVLDALKQAGVADKDLRTHSYSVQFEQLPPEPQPMVPDAFNGAAPQVMRSATAKEEKVKPGSKKGEESKTEEAKPDAEEAATPAPQPEPALPKGYYRVSNMVEVTVRELDRASALLRIATEAGANTVWGLSLDIEDRDVLVAEAREKAVAQARKNASSLAVLADVKLGHVVAVSEDSAGGTGPIYRTMAMEAKSMAADVPVERGEISVSHHVQLLFSIARE